MIIKTRSGRFINPGAKCDLYALSWHSIDECPGKQLDVEPFHTPPRKFSLEASKTPCPEVGPSLIQKRGREQRRDAVGRYTSGQKRGRLTVVT